MPRDNEKRREWARLDRAKNPEKYREWDRKRRAEIPEKRKAKNKEWRVANKDYIRVKHLQYNYGITVEDYDRMFKEQNGRCAICHTQQHYQRLAVDHCHKTGKVRGLLCQHCNRSIGLMFDSPLRLRNAADYIEKSRQTVAGGSETPSARELVTPAVPPAPLPLAKRGIQIPEGASCELRTHS